MNQHNLLLFILAFCFSSFSHAQPINIQGKVIDTKTKEAISYANISILNSRRGTYSDESGQFSIKVASTDTLLISFVGFANDTLSVGALGRNPLVKVELKEDSRQLSEITFSSKQEKFKTKSQKLGYHDRDKGTSLATYNPGLKLAVYISNKQKREGMIEKMLLRIKSRKPNKIRIGVYAANFAGRGGPQEKLLTDNYIITLNNHIGTLIVDLEKYNIRFPRNGVFVSVEFMGDLDKKGNLISEYPDETISSRVLLSKGGEYCHTWMQFMNRSWTLDRSQIQSGRNLMAGLQVGFFE